MRVRLRWWCCSFGFLVGRLVDMGRFGRSGVRWNGELWGFWSRMQKWGDVG